MGTLWARSAYIYIFRFCNFPPSLTQRGAHSYTHSDPDSYIEMSWKHMSGKYELRVSVGEERLLTGKGLVRVNPYICLVCGIFDHAGRPIHKC